MKYIIVGILAVILFLLIYQTMSKKKKNDHSEQPENQTDFTESTKEELPIQGAYRRCWMFSYNEKDAYQKLKPIAEELGYTVFAKVRILDLLEPVKGTPKYRTYFYKIQAKHVDFVLCDQKLVARHIIELDDSSHDREDRQARDKFVDEVLTSVGYNIIHIKSVDESIKKQLQIGETEK